MAPFSCPHCGARTPQGAAECPNCGLIFEKLLALEAKRLVEIDDAVHGRPRSPRPRDIRRRLRYAAFIAAGAAASGWLVWRLASPPAGLSPDPGSHIALAEGFAMGVPEGWTKYEGKEFKGRFLEALRLVRGWNPADVPRVVVVVTDRAALEVEPAVLMETVFPQALDSFSFSPDDEGVIDGLESRNRSGNGMRTNGATQEGMRFWLRTVKGAEKGYVIGVLATMREFDRPLFFENLVGSFRVLDRPLSGPHLWKLLVGQFREEAAVLVLGVVLAFYRWLLSDWD